MRGSWESFFFERGRESEREKGKEGEASEIRGEKEEEETERGEMRWDGGRKEEEG